MVVLVRAVVHVGGLGGIWKTRFVLIMLFETGNVLKVSVEQCLDQTQS